MRILDRSLRELAAGLRAREFSSVDLWREARAAMDATEPRLNAYKLRMDAFAERAASDADEALRAGRDLGVLFGTNAAGLDVFGGISDEMLGGEPLNPQLTDDTLLSTLRGGRGISPNGALKISVAAPGSRAVISTRLPSGATSTSTGASVPAG